MPLIGRPKVSGGAPVFLILLVTGVFAWSAWSPHDRFTWWLEIIPVLVAALILVPTWRPFPLTHLAYTLIAFHCVVLMVGGKYTYEQVPLFNWLRDMFHLSRNHYDRFAHVVQGFVPAIVVRELILRTSPLRPGGWLFTLVCATGLAISALYELVEWQAAVRVGAGADAFLGAQGDPWDAQADMALALAGAIVAQLLLGRYHDRQLQKALDPQPAPHTPVM